MAAMLEEKEFIEGNTADGKALERMNEQQLEDLRKKAMRERVDISRELTRQIMEVEARQEKLASLNELLAKRQRDKDALSPHHHVQLNGEQQSRVRGLVKETLDTLVVLRKRDPDGATDVDVRFLPGEETRGLMALNLHIGGEGAGSLHARFKVRLSEKVQSLAVQAARYWGLDPDKVFFLDRDSRIVPDSMLLKEIVLPPPMPTASGDSSMTKQGGAAEGHMERYRDGGLEYPVLEGRNYILTLVRAGTVLSKEDLSRPQGEEWQDFTFEPAKLEQELEATRKRHGDGGSAPGDVNLDEIPSLFDLIKQGQARKMRKKWDTRCRVCEFAMFLLCQILFYTTLVNDQVGKQMRLVAEAVENYYLQKDRFLNITTRDEYITYLNEVLQPAIVQPGMAATNLFVLGANGFLYQGDGPARNPDSCQAPTATLNASTPVVNATMTSTTSTTSSASTTATVQDQSTSSKCARLDFIQCSTPQRVTIFQYDTDVGEDLNFCQVHNSFSELPAWFTALEAQSRFSYIGGKVDTYIGGSAVPINLTDSSSYRDTMGVFTLSIDDDMWYNYQAKLIILYVYSPVSSGVLVMQLLMENTLSGMILTTIRRTVVDLSFPNESKHALLAWLVALAGGCLLMEIRRISGRPKRFFYEEDRDKCTKWTFLFLLLPVLFLAIYLLVLLRYRRDGHSEEHTLALDSDSSLTDTAKLHLYELYTIQTSLNRISLITLIVMNVLFFRYLLMYFPQLSFTSKMVIQVVKPLTAMLVFLFFAGGMIGIILYVTYSHSVSDFRTVMLTTITVIRMIMGGVRDWFPLYEAAPTLWIFITLVFFLCVTLNLNVMAVAIMLSHKKEKDLYENYTYHPDWTYQRSRAKKKDGEDFFNPARLGYIFEKGSEPREPPEIADQ